MSNRKYELFIFDIFIAILKIENIAKKFADAQSLFYDYISWDSVIREFEIIGEAAKKLISANMLSEENRVVVDFRNLLIHNYFGIDPEEVWDVINTDLPTFKNIIYERITSIETNLKAELIDDYIENNKHLDFIVGNLTNIREI